MIEGDPLTKVTFNGTEGYGAGAPAAELRVPESLPSEARAALQQGVVAILERYGITPDIQADPAWAEPPLPTPHIALLGKAGNDATQYEVVSDAGRFGGNPPRITFFGGVKIGEDSKGTTEVRVSVHGQGDNISIVPIEWTGRGRVVYGQDPWDLQPLTDRKVFGELLVGALNEATQGQVPLEIQVYEKWQGDQQGGRCVVPPRQILPPTPSV